MPVPTTIPVIAPTIGPDLRPWPERHTDPSKICPQQRREGASPDVAP